MHEAASYRYARVHACGAAFDNHGQRCERLASLSESINEELRLDYHLQSSRAGGISEGLVGLQYLTELESVRNQEFWIDLPGLHRL